jgi:hypothetical protein
MGFDSWQIKTILLFCKPSRPGVGPTLRPLRWVLGLFPGVERPLLPRLGISGAALLLLYAFMAWRVTTLLPLFLVEFVIHCRTEWMTMYLCRKHKTETWNLTSVFLYRHPLWAFSSNDLRVSMSTTDTCGYCTGTQNGADRLHDLLARSSTTCLLCTFRAVGIA